MNATVNLRKVEFKVSKELNMSAPLIVTEARNDIALDVTLDARLIPSEKKTIPFKFASDRRNQLGEFNIQSVFSAVLAISYTGEGTCKG